MASESPPQNPYADLKSSLSVLGVCTSPCETLLAVHVQKDGGRALELWHVAGHPSNGVDHRVVLEVAMNSPDNTRLMLSENTLCFSPCGRFIAVGGSGVHVLRLPPRASDGGFVVDGALEWMTSSCVGAENTGSSNQPCFLPDPRGERNGRFVALVDNSGNLSLHDMMQQKMVWKSDWEAQFEGLGEEKRAAVQACEVFNSWQSRQAMYSVSFSDDARWMCVQGDADSVMVFETCAKLRDPVRVPLDVAAIPDAFALRHYLPQRCFVFSSAFTHDSKILFVGLSEGSLLAFDVESGAELAMLENCVSDTLCRIVPLRASSYVFVSSFDRPVLAVKYQVSGDGAFKFMDTLRLGNTRPSWYNPCAVAESRGLLFTVPEDMVRVTALPTEMASTEAILAMCLALSTPETDLAQHLHGNVLYEPNVLHLIAGFLTGRSKMKYDE